MNIPNTMIRNANSRFGATRSDGGAAALIMVGVAVVAFAMCCSKTCAGPGLSNRHCG